MHETSSLSAFDAAAIVVVIAAVLSYCNHRFIRLPHVIGLTVMGAGTSVILILIDEFVPGTAISDMVEAFLTRIDFSQTLMQGMLNTALSDPGMMESAGQAVGGMFNRALFGRT